MNTSRKSAARAWGLTACALAVGLVMGHTAVRADNPHLKTVGDVSVLTPVASPYYPEGIAVNHNKVYIAGAATFGTAGNGIPSYVRSYNAKTGKLLKEFPIQGEDLAQEHANSCIAFDSRDWLYVINTQLGIVRINVSNGHQEIYAAPVPNLGLPGPGPLPNDIAFAPDGSLYETDSFQATIWRIRPDGALPHTPEVWFQDFQDLATAFGPNGIRVSPNGQKIYFSVTSEAPPSPIPALDGGKIYTLPLVDHPAVTDLHIFHQYSGDAPDGIAFGANGNLYVMLAAPYNSGISVLAPDGTPLARLSNPQPFTLTPFDSPANGAFDGNGNLLVTNHASLAGHPENAAILQVFVNDAGLPLIRP